MKNILVLIHDDKGQEARLQAALDITRALDGHLRCVDVTPFPVIAGDIYAGFGEAAIISDERESEARNKKALSSRLAKEDISWDWVDVAGEMSRCIRDEAALADLIILSRQIDTYPLPDMRATAGRILMEVRVPVMVVPEQLQRLELKRAMVAWDGQASCIAAVRAVVPVLALADEVEILTIRDGSIKGDPEDAARYLSRHGIHATLRSIDDGLHGAADLIDQECARWRADYLVMGAYSHGRLMETFGGVTKHMLGRGELPVIMGH